MDVGPRIAWTRLHSLASRAIYAVDNRSGEVLDLFAVFNAVAATFINVSPSKSYIFYHWRLVNNAEIYCLSMYRTWYCYIWMWIW